MAVDPHTIVQGLMARGVPQAAALGLAGNMAVESRYDPGINEIAPLVPGSRGGFGLIQWTGPRRRQLEAYAGNNVADVDTQLDFLVHELNTSESRARDAIYAAQDPETAARLVSEKFLRPGIPHLERRIEATRSLMGAEPANMPTQAPTAPPVAPQNALAMQPQAQQQNALQAPLPQFRNSLDVAMFQNPVNYQNALLRL